MVVVPAGSFVMGNPKDAADMLPWPGEMAYRYEWEQPAHEVTFARPFALGRTVVTRAQFAAYLTATGQDPGDGCLGRFEGVIGFHPALSWRDPGFAQSDDDPVVCVNRADAEGYLVWLSAQTGHSYRFPSEAEWEYAARAGTTTEFPWGDEAGTANANCKTCDTPYASKRTSPVATFAPNAWGLFDTAGNVWEPTLDCFQEGYDGAPTDGTARTALPGGPCERRVIRGGSWYDVDGTIRSAMRGRNGPQNRIGDLGFRVARDVKE